MQDKKRRKEEKVEAQSYITYERRISIKILYERKVLLINRIFSKVFQHKSSFHITIFKKINNKDYPGDIHATTWLDSFILVIVEEILSPPKGHLCMQNKRKLHGQILLPHHIATQKPIKDFTYLRICSHNPSIHMFIWYT